MIVKGITIVVSHYQLNPYAWYYGTQNFVPTLVSTGFIQVPVEAPRVALLNIHRTFPYKKGHVPPVPAKDAGYNPQEWAAKNRGIPVGRLVPEVVRIDNAPVIPLPPRPSKLELRKASTSKCKEQAEEKFLRVYNSDRFLFKEPSSQSCSRPGLITPLARQTPIARVTAPTLDHWVGSSATTPRYFPDGPNWGEDFPLSEADCIYLWNSGIVLSVEPRETPLLAVPKELNLAKSLDLIKLSQFFVPHLVSLT